MIPDIKRELLATLYQLWELSPDVRLGQLMAHLGFLGEAHIDRGLGDVDDDELLAIMYRHRAELTARLEGVPPLPTAPGAIVSIASDASSGANPSAGASTTS